MSVFSRQGLVIQNKTTWLAVVAILSITYLVPKIFAIHDESFGNGFDFRYIWLAGKIWASGQDPYGPLFAQEYHENFHLTLDTFWVYPPYWYPIALPFGLLSFQIAATIWKASNFLLLVGATHLIATTLADVTRRGYWSIFLSGIVFVCCMQATAATLYIGQTSILTYFGLGAIAFGVSKERVLLIIIGLVFLALKPQIGVVAFSAIAAVRRFRWTLFPAAAVCLLATAPIAMSGDYIASISGFLSNLARYSEFSGNTPPNMTGLINISNYAFANSALSDFKFIFIFLAIVVAFIAFYNLPPHRSAPDIDNTRYVISQLALLVASLFFFLPLHSYDLVGLAMLLMIIVATSLPGWLPMTIGILICFRPRNFIDALGISHSNDLVFPESYLISAGLFLLFVGAVWAALTSRRTVNGVRIDQQS